ncbi:MAG: WbqC family protein [Crocinitomicaceae bacterium]
MHEQESVILPLFYFGNIEYFYHLKNNETVFFDLQERYQKQSYRSRCTIIGANGIQQLSVPVEKPNGKNSLLSEVLVSQVENWKKDHLKAIESAYRRSPYYLYYIDGITKIIQTDFKYLFELNAALNAYLIKKTGLTVNSHFTKEAIALHPNDLRVNLHPKNKSGFKTHPYIQTFEERHGFHGNLSILDLLFNEGPNSISILSESHY